MPAKFVLSLMELVPAVLLLDKQLSFADLVLAESDGGIAFLDRS